MQRHFATCEKMLSAFETEGLLKQTKVTQFVIFARIASPIKFFPQTVKDRLEMTETH